MLGEEFETEGLGDGVTLFLISSSSFSYVHAMDIKFFGHSVL
jgi:hypothetical protein